MLRIRAVPAVIRVVLLMPALLLPGYWWYTYTGPYRWLAEFELRLHGEYTPIFTGVLIFLPCVLTALGIVLLVSSRVPFHEKERQAAVARDAAQTAFVLGHLPELTALILAVGLGGTGIYYLAEARLLGRLSDVNVETMEQGTDPPSRYVQLAGKLRRWNRMTLQESAGRATVEVHYIPVASQPSGGVIASVVLVVKDTQWNAPQNTFDNNLYVGTLRKLDPFVRAEFEHQGVQLTARAWQMKYLDGPGRYVEIGIIFMAIGSVALLTAIVLLVVRRIRS